MISSEFPVPHPIKSLAVALGVLANSGTPALAQGPEGRRAGCNWLRLADGKHRSVTGRGQSIAANASLPGLVQKSDSLVGFTGYFEADKRKVGVYTDLVFSKLGFAASQVDYRNPVRHLKVSTQASAAPTHQTFIAEMGGVHEVA